MGDIMTVLEDLVEIDSLILEEQRGTPGSNQFAIKSAETVSSKKILNLIVVHVCDIHVRMLRQLFGTP